MGDSRMRLTKEQMALLRTVAERKNVLVDACVGSGKTTAIQEMCRYFGPNVSALYLTYNRLLKEDAKKRIRSSNTAVTNYHGFAYGQLIKNGIRPGRNDSIQAYCRMRPPVPHYDIMILDEYQDIDKEIAEMLSIIKGANPGMQIVAVGDMAQKIYDKTTLDVRAFMQEFLGEHVRLEFTRCFRLGRSYAEKIGMAWSKKIVGVNEHCHVSGMTFLEAVKHLRAKEPGDVLCLGARTGDMAKALNNLERTCPEKYNKRTVYASIQDSDGMGGVKMTDQCAIFTTYDSSKGLERPTCMVFDFTEAYWASRASKPMVKYEILRNIFLVACSRGKEEIIFVQGEQETMGLGTLMRRTDTKLGIDRTVDISKMFDFKYKEDVEAAFGELAVEQVPTKDRSPIAVKDHDELIDLSPCIGIYQEAAYFKGFDIDRLFLLAQETNPDMLIRYDPDAPLDENILRLAAINLGQDRYASQVELPFIEDSEREALFARLSERLSRTDEGQVACSIPFKDGRYEFEAKGFADAVKDGIPYELKFVTEVTHEHFLQAACYAVALACPYAFLWNTRDNSLYKVSVPDRKAFLDKVAIAVSKGIMSRSVLPAPVACPEGASEAAGMAAPAAMPKAAAKDAAARAGEGAKEGKKGIGKRRAPAGRTEPVSSLGLPDHSVRTLARAGILDTSWFQGKKAKDVMALRGLLGLRPYSMLVAKLGELGFDLLAG